MIEWSSSEPSPSGVPARRCANFANTLRVVVLDEPQVRDALRIPAPVRRRMERLVDAEVRVRPHARFLDHLHRDDVRAVRLPGQRDHLELHVEQLAEVVRRADRRIGQVGERLRCSP